MITPNFLLRIGMAAFYLFHETRGASAADKASPGAAQAPEFSQSTEDRAEAQTLVWLKHTVREPYDRVGKRDPRWDEAARKALDEYVLVLRKNGDPDGSRIKAVGAAAHQAVLAGCNDPFIAYLDFRFGTEDRLTSSPEQGAALRRVAQQMMDSDYPPIRKFFVCLRASGPLLGRAGQRTNDAPEALPLRRVAARYLGEAMADKTTPIEQIYEAWVQLREPFRDVGLGAPAVYAEAYGLIEKPLFENWPSNSTAYLIKGLFFTDHAWDARGRAPASIVSGAAWKPFGNRLEIAAEALETAWRINAKDPRIAIQMMSVELGQGKGRERLDLWFNRAMNLDTNSLRACQSKAGYLEPKWYGSPEEMLAFARECVQSTNWGGAVPMIMVDVHEALARYLPRSEADRYWRKPDVWPDFKAAYEKYLQLNPTAIGGRTMYASYAAKCGQWDEFDKILKRFAPLPDNEKLDMARFERFLMNRDYTNAYQLAGRISDAQPNNAQLQNELAWRLLSDPGIQKLDLELAEKIASRANEALHGKNAFYLETLARVRFMQGKKESAIALQEKAVNIALGPTKSRLERILGAYRNGELPKIE